MTIPPALEDEISAINAIYAPATLSIQSSSDPSRTTLLLSPPPDHPFHPLTFLLSFPAAYPDEAPSVQGIHSVGSASKGASAQATSQLRASLQQACRNIPGEVCIHSALQDIESRVDDLNKGGCDSVPGDSGSRYGVHPEGDCNEAQAAVTGTTDDLGRATTTTNTVHSSPVPETVPALFTPKWTVTPPTEVHKSVFVGRVCAVTSAACVAAATRDLLGDKKVAKATHNIRAWRIRGSSAPKANPEASSNGVSASATAKAQAKASPSHQECDDDGETAAGSRVLNVMAAMDVWDVLVVVSRWYGGVKLGPERFRVIGRVAREALVEGGFGEKKG